MRYNFISVNRVRFELCAVAVRGCETKLRGASRSAQASEVNRTSEVFKGVELHPYRWRRKSHTPRQKNTMCGKTAAGTGGIMPMSAPTMPPMTSA